MLAESPVWEQEIEGFLRGAGVVDEESRLAALQPYRPGKIPLVFVHGTASSAGRWAQMLNELWNDPRIHERYQFWLYTYDTGNPILYSRHGAARGARWLPWQRLDPEARTRHSARWW